MTTSLEQLTRKLDLSQSVGRDTAKKWASRVREFEAQGIKLDQAAIFAAREVFPADFKDTRYNFITIRSPNC